MSYRFLSPALTELAAAEYYERHIAGFASDFIDEVDAAISRIVRFPNAWAPIADDFRHCNLRRFPYTLIYYIESDGGILIVSVFHQSRKPMSWKHNL